MICCVLCWQAGGGGGDAGRRDCCGGGAGDGRSVAAGRAAGGPVREIAALPGRAGRNCAAGERATVVPSSEASLQTIIRTQVMILQGSQTDPWRPPGGNFTNVEHLSFR